MSTIKTYDVAVVGAGVFGAWTAYQLSRAGAEVILVDAYGPGNSRASSGGESRMIRMGYGPDQIYTRMAQRSLERWQELFELTGPTERSHRLFQPTGILWLAHENDPYSDATLKTLEQCHIAHEKLDRAELLQRYPQLELGPVRWAIHEPDSGVLMARQAVQAVVAQARSGGVTYLEEAVLSPESEMGGMGEKANVRGKMIATVARSREPQSVSPIRVEHSERNLSVADAGRDRDSKLDSLQTLSGVEVLANEFVFAGGPWLPKIFPTLLTELIQVTRQEVFFFGVPAADDSGNRYGPERLPAWIDFNDLVYGIPNLDGRGFKIAMDTHGPSFDPDTGDRIGSPEGLSAVRAYLAGRMPELANAPVTEMRVCQYENTSNGDFLIDRHPAFENVWLVGGGSGHGFKHGPAVGEHVAALISGDAKVEPRFALSTKEKVQQRTVF